MHHHHHSTSILSSSLSEGVIAHQRRRKKRPNYGTRTVEVRRGYNGFGFTISGQQPCRLSCIVQHSPADQAGLRAGDFLISVNGLGVSKLPHETVVQLIGNSFGSIRMQIAENYFSDSSDEENAFLLQRKQFNSTMSPISAQCGISGINSKPRFLYHRNKVHRLRNSPNKQGVKHHLQTERPHLRNSSKKRSDLQTLRPLIEDLPLTLQLTNSSKSEKKATEIKIDGAQQISSDVANVSAMVRIPHAALEYRVIVGYLGTIEMPKQISNNSKLQTVRSCIRKLRQEKRQPSTVLMTILPDCLRLQSSNGTVLASYASERLNYVSSSSESENRFFGLVTSSIHTSQADEEDNDDTESRDFSTAVSPKTKNISISNSCHVFVIDTKLCNHQYHKLYADQFHIQCTEDPISNLCLEFPNNSEYVVNLIRSMYTMRILPAATYKQHDVSAPNMNYAGASHSPQPSNISEVSTTTSNSDSGIGFYNDVKSISDRILVVDFPKRVDFRMCNTTSRPSGIFNTLDVIVDKRLTVRAMPDPVTDITHQVLPELSSNFNVMNSSLSNLHITRSCDDVLSMVERTQTKEDLFPHTSSLNNISLNSLSTPTVNNTIFLHPSCVEHIAAHKQPINDSSHMSQKKSDITNTQSSLQIDTSLSYKLSPQVFVSNTKCNPKSDKNSLNLEINDSSLTSVTSNAENYLYKWNSLQNLETTLRNENRDFLGATNSEPNLGENCDLEIGASPQRCAWGHSSFRTPRTDKHLKNQSPLVRRTASMTASDNDVSIRSVTDSCKEFCQNQLQHRIPVFDNQNAKLTTNRVVISNLKLSQGKKEIMEELTTSGATAWGNSFERMLEDPFGLHTFAEFLKKEFSAENIYFWTACERYRQLENKSDRSVQALSIFNKHLGDGAIEPVNVDSHARNLSEEKLKSAEIDIFLPAQKQIFNLMKFDSYQRFIRSDLYKSCLEAEQKKQPLPYRMEDFDELLQTHSHQNSLSKLKKSASNAEDRRRKSLLPWHRKMRSKSRDRESENSKSIICKVPQLAVNSLKIPSVFQSNSISDIHSSRSSLSSFDALPSAHIGNQVDVHSSESITCSLCRVILSDGATTIVQIRPDDTVRQLVERLLEKRGLIYKFYDVVINGSAKSIDLQNSAAVIAGKEVLIEQRVAFKLDLPDPKVISVKSKPKKQLQEVVRPILLKYNYSIDNVHVVFRDTHEMVDLSLPVTIVDGQRLQIIQIEKPNTSKYSKQCLLKSSSFPIKVDQLSFISEEKSNIYSENTGQTTLDEITNKVFSELLQGKVEAHASNKRLSIPPNDVCSLKSDDYVSESSSLFNRIREKNNQGLIPKNKFFCNQSTEENVSNFKSTILTDGGISQAQATEIKKPIIAKLKAGVKVQVTERMTENQDELLEGLKRAQLARLEDQRGTEINFELPDFLKNKENMSEAASNLRKVRANLSPISKQITLHEPISSLKDLPQPAPRFSITNKKSTSIFSKNCDLQSLQPQIQPDKSGVPVEVDIVLGGKSPPPLPPKPKVLPTKPSNWGVSPVIGTSSSSLSLSSKIPLSDHSRKTQLSNERCYIEETSSSFV